MASAPAGYIGVPTQVPIIEQTEQLVYISSKNLEKYFTVGTMAYPSGNTQWTVSDTADGKAKLVPSNFGKNNSSSTLLLRAKVALSNVEIRGEYYTESGCDKIFFLIKGAYQLQGESGSSADASRWKGNLSVGDQIELEYKKDSSNSATNEANTNFYLVAQVKEMVDTVVGYETKNVARKIKKAYIGVNGVAKKVKKAYVGVKPITIPPDYTQLEYIQSSGTQYIDTGFKPNDNTRVVLDGQFTSSAVSQFLFGCRTGTNTVNYCILTRAAGFRSDYGESKVENTSVANTERFIFDKNKNICTIGSAEITNAVSTFQSAYSLALFASNDGGSAKYYGSMKLYSCKIYDNGTIVRDYVPCKNAVGTVGLYDLVQSQFYENAGTDVFAAGPDVGTLELPSAARLCFKDERELKYHSTTAIRYVQNSMKAATVGDYALFAGGTVSGGSVTNRVNSCDRSLTFSLANTLNDNMTIGAATSLNGDYAFFGGGKTNIPTASVQVYNKSLTRISASALGEALELNAATAVGKYALFGGGKNKNSVCVELVSAYNSSLTKKNVSSPLNDAKCEHAATTVGGYALFAGGYNNTSTYYSSVDAYDASLTRTIPTAISVARQGLAATTVGDYALFAGGTAHSGYSDVVDAYNTALTRSKPPVLSEQRSAIPTTTVCGFALFAGGYKAGIYSFAVEAYDAFLTRTLATSLPTPSINMAAATIGDYALFAGGYATINGSNEITDKVYVYTAE